MVVLKFIKSIKDTNGIFIVVDSSLRFYEILIEERFEIAVPELEFELLSVGVFGGIEGLYYFDCLHVSEGQLLTFHLINKKLNQVDFSYFYDSVKAAEY